MTALNLSWKEENRGKARSRYHGLTQAEVEAHLAAQDGKCALCGEGGLTGQNMHGDHDHETGVFRGVLCRKCNCGLGFLRDDPDLCRKATTYLQRGKLF